MWLAVAAVLVAALGVALRNDAPAPPPLSARATPVRPKEPAPAPTPVVPEIRVATKRPMNPMTTEPVYEGLPRLEVASIDLPDPLHTSRLGAEPIHTPGIEVMPLSVSTLPNEQENK